MQKRLTVLLLIAGIGACRAGQVVPFHLTRNGLVGIDARVDGTPARGVLDSGTGTFIVSKAFASTLGLKLGLVPRHAIGGGSGPQLLYTVHVRQVRLGPIALRNVSGVASDLEPLSENAGFQLDALFGYPFFKDHVIRINYPKQQVTFYDQAHAPACPSPIPITFWNNVPVVTAQAMLPESHLVETVHLVVDLGTAKAAAAFGSRFMDTKIGKALDAGKHAVVTGNGLGGKVSSIKAELPELRIGRQHFYELPVGMTRGVAAFNGNYISGSLGVLLWNSGTITFDYPDHTLCIQPGHD